MDESHLNGPLSPVGDEVYLPLFGDYMAGVEKSSRVATRAHRWELPRYVYCSSWFVHIFSLV